MTKDDNTKRDAALHLLRTGRASPAEVATLAGETRQLVNYWIAAAGLDWRKARAEWLRKQWRAVIS